MWISTNGGKMRRRKLERRRQQNRDAAGGWQTRRAAGLPLESSRMLALALSRKVLTWCLVWWHAPSTSQRQAPRRWFRLLTCTVFAWIFVTAGWSRFISDPDRPFPWVSFHGIRFISPWCFLLSSFLAFLCFLFSDRSHSSFSSPFPTIR